MGAVDAEGIQVVVVEDNDDARRASDGVLGGYSLLLLPLTRWQDSQELGTESSTWMLAIAVVLRAAADEKPLVLKAVYDPGPESVCELVERASSAPVSASVVTCAAGKHAG